MPEGQFSGTRNTYEYLSDNGTTYLVTLDDTLATVPGNGLTLATTSTTGVTLPKRFEPRGVYWQGVLSGRTVRKFIVCSTNATFYTDRSAPLTIDGVAGFTTGRVGEKLTFPKLAAATP